LHMECAKCHAALTIPLNKLDRDAPELCPNCGERWGTKTDDKQPKEYIAEFALSLRSLQREMGQPSRGFALTFELVAPSSSGQD
jgi:uncharacterized metal-binding protein YceD (DUF177 family)